MIERLKPNQDKTYYHVMSRCAQQQYWLEEPKFKRIFISLMQRLSKIYYIDVLSDTVMSNHVHLCLELTKPEPDEADIQRRFELAQTYVCNPRPFNAVLAKRYYRRYTNLSSFMWELKWRFSRAYNADHQTKGAFWEGRFKSMVIDDGDYLLQCMTYIDLNPVRARMVHDPEDFEFSSIRRIKETLEQEDRDLTPAVGRLAHLPDGDRGRAYLELSRYLAARTRAEEKRRSDIPDFLKYWIGAKLLNETMSLFESKTLSNWSVRIYGSDRYVADTLKAAGMRERNHEKSSNWRSPLMAST